MIHLQCPNALPWFRAALITAVAVSCATRKADETRSGGSTQVPQNGTNNVSENAKSDEGKLPKKIDEMLTLNTFADWLIANTDFSGGDGNSGPSDAEFHADPNSCSAPPEHITVRIRSEKHVKKFKTTDVGSGVVLARLHNTHPKCATTGFVLRANQIVYWIVEPNGAGGLQSRFVEDRSATDLPADRGWVECTGSGHPKDHKLSKSEVRTGLMGQNPCQYRSPSTMSLEDWRLRSHNARPWVTCDVGCCMAADF